MVIASHTHKKANAALIIAGSKIRARREALGIAMAELAAPLGVSRQRIFQIENGDFTPESSIIERTLQLLGYPRPQTLDTLSDTPEAPAWVDELRRDQEAERIRRAQERQNENYRRKSIAQALKTVRIVQGLSQENIAKSAGIPVEDIVAVESCKTFDPVTLSHVVTGLNAHMRVKFPDAEAVDAYVTKHNIEIPNTRHIKPYVDKLGAASLTLRTHWGLTGHDLEAFCPPQHPVQDRTILALENPNHSYGNGVMPTPGIIAGIITALYNADQQQPREKRLLNAPAIKSVVNMANRGEPILYGKHTEQLVKAAIDAIAEAAERDNSPSPRSINRQRGIGIGLQHPNTVGKGLSR